MQEDTGDAVQSLCHEDSLEEEIAIHSSIHAWKIPWTEEPGRLQSMGSHRVGHDWAHMHRFLTYNTSHTQLIVEKAMATHSSTLAWRILWTEEPGGLLSMGLHRVRHNWSDLARFSYVINREVTWLFQLTHCWQSSFLFRSWKCDKEGFCKLLYGAQVIQIVYSTIKLQTQSLILSLPVIQTIT